MPRKPANLEHIANLAQLIGEAYPENHRRLAEAHEMCSIYRRDPPGPARNANIRDQIHAANCWTRVCNHYRDQLTSLFAMLCRHLPELAKQTRYVGSSSPLRDDLPPLLAELQTIRVEALRLADDQPLTDAQQEVFDLIRQSGPIAGKQICKRLGIEQSNLTSRIIPVLKARRGVQNKAGAGYFMPSTSCSIRSNGAL